MFSPYRIRRAAALVFGALPLLLVSLVAWAAGVFA